MALLALGTWWLVRNTPRARRAARRPAPPRHEPDYSMRGFTVQRFAPDGALRVQIEGDALRHYPDTDTLEIDSRAHPRDRAPTAASRGQRAPRAGQRRRQRGAAARRRAACCARRRRRPRRSSSAASSCTPSCDTERVALAPAGAADAGRRASCAPAALEYDNLTRSVELEGPRARGHSPRRAVAPQRRDAAPRRRDDCRPLVFITGASSGIGQALAARFHRAGYRLALVGAARRRDRALGARATGFDGRARAWSTPPTCATSQRSPPPAAPASPRRALPDVVIANAGISVGIDTADARRPGGDARDLRDQQLGLAATFHPFVAADARARAPARWSASPASPAIRGLPGHGAYCASKAARDRLLRKPARRVPAVRRQGGDDRAGLCRHAADARQPLFDAVPDAAPTTLPTARCAAIAAGTQLPRDPVADGRGRQAAAAAAERRCSTGCSPAVPRKHARRVANRADGHEEKRLRCALHQRSLSVTDDVPKSWISSRRELPPPTAVAAAASHRRSRRRRRSHHRRRRHRRRHGRRRRRSCATAADRRHRRRRHHRRRPPPPP